LNAQDSKKLAVFSILKNITLSQVQKKEFPFSEASEEFYTIELKDRKLIVDQFTGNVLNNIPYPKTTILANLSLNLHTGRINIFFYVFGLCYAS
jgi:sulfite reductase (NADPH) flavoprotein alpha-component